MPNQISATRNKVREADAISTARILRREETDAERQLWLALRDRRLGGVKFRRQVPIGRYVADFLSVEASLIVEVDGGQHAHEQAEYDAQRTADLRQAGYSVIRFWNRDVLKNLPGVLDAIYAAVDATPSPQPSPPRGRGGKKRGAAEGPLAPLGEREQGEGVGR